MFVGRESESGSEQNERGGGVVLLNGFLERRMNAFLFI